MFQIPQVIGLTYQKFLHLTAQHDTISPVEYKLSALQLHSQAMDGLHGMEVELATCLGAVMAQVCFLLSNEGFSYDMPHNCNWFDTVLGYLP